eukprot:136018_1
MTVDITIHDIDPISDLIQVVDNNLNPLGCFVSTMMTRTLISYNYITCLECSNWTYIARYTLFVSNPTSRFLMRRKPQSLIRFQPIFRAQFNHFDTKCVVIFIIKMCRDQCWIVQCAIDRSVTH